MRVGDTAWPNLLSPGTRKRARGFARESELWDELTAALDPLPEIPVYRWSQRQDFKRTGSRVTCDEGLLERLLLTEQAALGLWLEHPAANLDFLNDLLWTWCETTTWCKAASSEGDYQARVELVSSQIGRRLSDVLRLFKAEIDPEVYQRVHSELEGRIIKLAFVEGPDFWNNFWWTSSHNWNLVCNGNVIQTALNLYDDSAELARTIHPLINRLTYAIDGFGNDGSCFEGIGYWHYGFGQFLELAYCLSHRTDGKLNLLDDPKIQRICRFPLAMRLDESAYATLSDSAHLTHLRYEIPTIINYFMDVPELLTMVEMRKDGSPAVVQSGNDQNTYFPERWRVLALNGNRPLPSQKLPTEDVNLQDYGYLRATRNGTTLATVAGHNDMPHNHNDVGSFILRCDGITFLTDPGVPVYDAKTFSEERYNNIFCRSLGHSVPLINGKEQSQGAEFNGTIESVSCDNNDSWTATMEMASAYPDETLTSLKRTFDLLNNGDVELKDAYSFESTPQKIEENFVTFEPVQVLSDGQKVCIGSKEKSISMSTICAGNFSVQKLENESKACGREPLWRISFIPTELSTEFTITFVMNFYKKNYINKEK